MADISLLFDVAGGGSLSGESGKLINEQLTSIVNKINENPFRIKIIADEKSLVDLIKRIEEIRKSIGDGGLIKIDSAELSGITKTLNQISDSLIRIMGAVGKNSATIGKFGGQLQDIFEAIPAESNTTAKSIGKITDSFSDLVDMIGELSETVGQINNKRFGATINLTGGVQESMEQVTAYREYLTALLKDFNDLNLSYQHLMQNSSNPRYSGMAYAAGSAVSSNKKLLDTIRGFNFNDMIAQTGIMDFDQLKQTISLYESLIASMTNIQYKGSAIFSAGDRTAIDAARQKIQDIEHSMDSIGEGPAESAGNSIFDYVDKIREAIETLNSPLDTIKTKINEALDLSDIPEDKRNALTSSVQALSDSISGIFSELRGKIEEALDFSTIPDDGDKALIDSLKNDCEQIEELFLSLRGKIESVFDFSDVDTSSVDSIIDRIQEALNGLTLDLGKVNVTGSVRTQSDIQDNVNLIRETRQLRDLIPEGVKIDTSVSEKTLTQISGAMQRLSIAEDNAGTLSNLFKNLSGTITEVTTKIINQGEATERLKNVTIKGIDEEGQAFTRTADYFVKHSKKKGEYYDSQTTTIRKQVIAQQEQVRATKGQAKAEEEALKSKKKTFDASLAMTEEENRLWEEHIRNQRTEEQYAKANVKTYTDLMNAQEALTEARKRSFGESDAWERIEKEKAAEEELTRSLIAGYDKREDAAEQAEKKAVAEANSLERRNELIKESLDLEAQLTNMAARSGATDEQKGKINEQIEGLKAWREAVKDGEATNDSFASVIGRTRMSIKGFNAEMAGAAAPIRNLEEGTAEYADALKNIQTSIGNAQNALINFSAAEKSSNESSRAAYENIGAQIQKLRDLEAAVRSGSVSEKDFKVRLSDINTEIKENSNVIRENGDAHRSLGEGVAKTIKNFSQWLGVSRIMMGAIRTIKQMVSAVIELDTAMTELRKVTDETEARYDKFLEDAGVRAKQVGASLKDTVSATADFARLGYSVDQAEKLADAAIIYKNVGDGISDITEASESIIATMQAFAIKPEDVMSIVDKFNDVGNKFAISSGGVGEALLRSAAAMQAANNTIDETIALATAANKVIQNPQIVGTSLKTISMYLRAAKTEAEEAGIETDDMAESVSKLRDEILRLTGNRVDIQIDENTFKSTYQILKELSEVWNDLSDISQANIQALIGQKRNGNIVAGIMNNFSEAEKVLEVSMNALGSAEKENEKVLASIQGRINKFKASFEVLSRTVVNGELIKVVVDSGTWILNTVTSIAKLIDSFGGLKTALLATSVVLVNIPSVASKIASAFVGVGDATKSLVVNGFNALSSALYNTITAIPNAIAAWKSYAAGVVSANTAMQESMPVIGLLLTAITAVVAGISKARAAEEERRRTAILAGDQARAESEEILELLSSYESLNEQVKTDESVKDDLKTVTDQLIQKLGLEKEAVDELSGSYNELTDAIRRKAVNQLAEDQRDLVAGLEAAEKDLLGAGKKPLINGASYSNAIEVTTSLNDSDRNAINKLISMGLLQGMSTNTNTSPAPGGPSVTTYSLLGGDDLKSASGIYQAYERLGKILDELNHTTGVSEGLYEAVEAEYNKLKEAARAYGSAVTGLNDNLSAQAFIQRELGGADLPQTVEEFNAYRQSLLDTATAVRMYGGDVEDVAESLDNLLKKDYRFAKFYEDASNAGTVGAGSTSGGAPSTETISQATKDFNEYKKAIGDLGKALGEFQEQGTVSAETYRDLAEGNEKYQELFKFTDKGIELQTDKLNTYVESLEQEYGTKMALAGATEDEIRILSALGDTLVTVAEDNSNVAGEIEELHGYIKDMNDGTKYTYKQIVDLTKKYPKLENAIEDTGDGYRIEISAIEDLIAVKAQYIELTDRETEVVKARNALNLRNNGNATASTKIDEIFERFEAAYNKAITSREEFETAFAEVFGHAYEGGYEEYDRYIDALIAKNKSFALTQEIMQSAIEGTTEALEETSEAMKDVQSDLDGLTDVLKDLNEGREYGTSEIITLLNKYPALRDHIIRTANGYKIETSAVKELINAKAQLLTLAQREISVTTARDALTTKDGRTVQADNADKVFAMFKDKYGRNIASIDEYKEAYKEFMGYTAKSSVAYAQAMIDALRDSELSDMFAQDYIDQLPQLEGYTPEKSSSSSSEKDVETEFERAYKAHQHKLAMDQETEEQYLNWLDGAYQASFNAQEMELDDYYRYEEEVYEKRKELFQTHLDEMQHRVDLLSHQTKDTSEEQIAIYEAMQKELNAQANRYRARGIKDNDALIRELQNQWWQYEENIRQLRESAFDDWVSDRKFVIDQLKLDDADTGEIISSWKEILERITSELTFYSNRGYDITSDVVQSLLGEMQSAKEAMIAALDEVVQKANEVVDGFENVYKTLTDAAKEYASTGYLSVDSLQAILGLGPKYLDMLMDESGQLVINEDRLRKVIAARTEEMAAETALSYAKQILLATEQDDTRALKELTDAQAASSSGTWEMAYATLGYARALAASKGMSTEFYDNAVSYVTKMQSVTKTAVESVSAYYDTLRDGYVSQAEGLETILKLTEDMIKQENSDRIDELEKEKDLYKDIIDEKKEILRITKEQEDHDRSTADKLKEIADLQSKIDQLALDDSREAQAQRVKLEAELYEKQRALADDQADYAYEAQTDALDKQYEEYEKEKDDEIDALKDMLSSAEKLYRAAIDRISNGWDTLYDDLLNWNYQYGSTLEKDLTKAWDAAKAAAERYGSFVDAMSGVKDNTNLGAASVTPSSAAVQNALNIGSAQFGGAKDIIAKMRANSIAWFTGDQAFLAGENRKLANDYKAATGKTLDYRNGLWYEEGSSTPIYNLANDQAARNQIGNAVVAAMKSNSELWKSADASVRTDLERRNEDLAAKLANFLGKPITKTRAGIWMLGDTPLYSVTKFHSGGIAGGGTFRQNEIMALLRKGEAVLDEKREQGLYHVVDFVQILSDKIGRAIDSGRISSLLNGTAPVFQNIGAPALAGGIGTMNFSPTVNVTIAGAGNLSESTARKYGNIAAESVLEQLKGAFSQRGVSNVGNSILK